MGVYDLKQFFESTCVNLMLLYHCAYLELHEFKRGDYAFSGMFEIVDNHVDEHLVHAQSLLKRVVLF